MQIQELNTSGSQEAYNQPVIITSDYARQKTMENQARLAEILAKLSSASQLNQFN